MPFPSDHVQGDDDCVRCALAYLLDMHPSRVKYFRPHRHEEIGEYDMWGPYKDWVHRRTGLEMMVFANEDAISLFLDNEDKRWIALVPAMRDRRLNHAIVMQGAKLLYDPNGKPTKNNIGQVRRVKPKKINGAIVLADDVRYEDGYLSFIY